MRNAGRSVVPFVWVGLVATQVATAQDPWPQYPRATMPIRVIHVGPHSVRFLAMPGMTRDEQRRWLAQWRAAGPELERIRLQELDAADLGQIADALEDAYRAAAPERARSTTSGLVEQQRAFHRGRGP